MKLSVVRKSVAVGCSSLLLLLTVACSPSDEDSDGLSTNVDTQERRAYALLEALAGPDNEAAERAYDQVSETGDRRYVSVLLELLRADQIGIVPRPGTPYIDALHRLTKKRFGSDWLRWVEWYGQTDLTPPMHFDRWKGSLFARLDPRFEDFIHAGVPSRIRLEEIQWGGVQVDGIPALDDPRVLDGQGADYLTDEEPVFGMVVGGEARAYPLRILDWHEMVNDELGGVRFSLAYCTLCGSVVAYSGESPEGDTFTFGSSGLLHQSNKLMYDRQTNSLWAQFIGEPVLGELVNQNITLDRLPVVLSRWGDWIAQHPSTTVLDVRTGFNRPYELGAAYGDYFFGGETLFPVSRRSDRLETKARVFGLNLEGRQRAYPVTLLTEERVVNDELGGTKVVIVADRGVAKVAATERPRDQGDIFYEAGGEVRAFKAGDHLFSPTDRPGRLVDESGHRWRVREKALVGPDGVRLRRLLSQDAFWFAWHSFFPRTSIYGKG